MFQLSVLVKPGRYCFECLHVVQGNELDIVGDIGTDGSPKDIVFCCQGQVFSMSIFLYVFVCLWVYLQVQAHPK